MTSDFYNQSLSVKVPGLCPSYSKDPFFLNLIYRSFNSLCLPGGIHSKTNSRQYFQTTLCCFLTSIALQQPKTLWPLPVTESNRLLASPLQIFLRTKNDPNAVLWGAIKFMLPSKLHWLSSSWPFLTQWLCFSEILIQNQNSSTLVLCTELSELVTNCSGFKQLTLSLLSYYYHILLLLLLLNTHLQCSQIK